MKDLRDVSVLVTGGTSGLGRQLCVELGRAGAFVLVGGRNQVKISRVIQEISESGGRASSVFLDLREAQELAELPSNLDFLPHLDILVHNAGTFAPVLDKRIASLEIETIQELFAVNAIAPLILTRSLLPMLVRGTRRQIITICSDDSSPSRFDGEYSTYSMTKAALNMMMLGLSIQLKERDFHVFGYDPGWMRTPMGGANAPGDPKKEAIALIREIAKRQPSINGQIIDVAGVTDWWSKMTQG